MQETKRSTKMLVNRNGEIGITVDVNDLIVNINNARTLID